MVAEVNIVKICEGKYDILYPALASLENMCLKETSFQRKEGKGENFSVSSPKRKGCQGIEFFK